MQSKPTRTQRGHTSKEVTPLGKQAGSVHLAKQRPSVAQSVFLWQRTLRESQGALAIMGDALGVLHDARRFKAKDNVLNIMAELALIIASSSEPRLY